MKKLYEKSELAFALTWIVIYCIAQSLANPFNRLIGIEGAANAVFNLALTIILFCWIRNNGLLSKYGLCRTSIPARKFLWYIPLLILASGNLWFGAVMNLPVLDMACYICYMLCVGFVEEILFRGFLFKAIERDSVKQAVVISSVTFGLGHLLHLIDGSGMELAANLCQVAGAIAIGFLFVTIFHRGESLLPCIATHSAIDVLSAFANEAVLTTQKRIIFSVVRILIAAAYALILTKTLPEKRRQEAENQR